MSLEDVTYIPSMQMQVLTRDNSAYPPRSPRLFTSGEWTGRIDTTWYTIGEKGRLELSTWNNNSYPRPILEQPYQITMFIASNKTEQPAKEILIAGRETLFDLYKVLQHLFADVDDTGKICKVTKP